MSCRRLALNKKESIMSRTFILCYRLESSYKTNFLLHFHQHHQHLLVFVEILVQIEMDYSILPLWLFFGQFIEIRMQWLIFFIFTKLMSNQGMCCVYLVTRLWLDKLDIIADFCLFCSSRIDSHKREVSLLIFELFLQTDPTIPMRCLAPKVYCALEQKILSSKVE